MYRQESHNVHTLLAGEGQLREMISAGAPLPQILDRVCTALDVRVGNVVSLVLLPDDEEHTLHTTAQSAAKFGLTAFSRMPILSPSEEFFGTLETYSRFSREATRNERASIERAAHLAALAIQRYNDEVERDDSLDWTGATGRRHHERRPSNN
jgi:GAF domain